jgi:hypothetical protein
MAAEPASLSSSQLDDLRSRFRNSDARDLAERSVQHLALRSQPMGIGTAVLVTTFDVELVSALANSLFGV